jgi:glycosyltransferase involved in cell wall biosynthesis
VLLHALAELATTVPNVVLLLAGAGPLRDDLEAEAARLGIAERVRFLGLRRDRETLYAAMDIFVLPSHWEGLSLALVEAMGSGRAVVATVVGGNPEVVADGRTGLLVPPNDHQSLADALTHLGLDQQVRGALGEAAAADARARFSIEQHVAQLAALYRRGLEERARQPALVEAER